MILISYILFKNNGKYKKISYSELCCPRGQLSENQRKRKNIYLDFARELKKTVGHEGYGDTSGKKHAWNVLQENWNSWNSKVEPRLSKLLQD